MEYAELFVAEMAVMRQFRPVLLRPRFIGYTCSAGVSSTTNVRSHFTRYTCNRWGISGPAISIRVINCYYLFGSSHRVYVNLHSE